MFKEDISKIKDKSAFLSEDGIFRVRVKVGAKISQNTVNYKQGKKITHYTVCIYICVFVLFLF